MKKNIIYLTVLIVWLAACTKEELLIVDQPLTLDDKSEEMQAYQAERALEYIKMYRFEKVPEVFEQITDQNIINELKQSWQVYLEKAKQEAFVLVTLKNDTLYYKHKGTENSSAVTNLTIDYAGRAAHQPNEKGKFYGFERYPNLQRVTLTSSMATELAGFEKNEKLQQFTWTSNRANFEYWYPNETFSLPEPKIDFSRNASLTTVTLTLAKISNVTFPEHKLNIVRVNNAELSEADLDRVNAKAFILDRCDMPNEHLVIKNKLSDEFTYGFGNIKTIDISETNLKTLNVNGTNTLQTIAFNDQLEAIQIGNTIGIEPAYIVETDKFPQTLKTAFLSPKSLTSFDFSHLTNLTKLTLQGDSLDYSDLLVAPITTDLTLSRGYIPSLNFEKLNTVTTLLLQNLGTTDEVKLPSKIKSLTFQRNTTKKLDLSALNVNNDITRLSIQNNTLLEEIVFPENLSQSQFTNSFNLQLLVRKDCRFVNKPVWLDTYVTYMD